MAGPLPSWPLNLLWSAARTPFPPSLLTWCCGAPEALPSAPSLSSSVDEGGAHHLLIQRSAHQVWTSLLSPPVTNSPLFWQPTPVLSPGKSQGRRSLEGCSLWGHKESDTTERLPFHFSLSCIGEGNGNPLLLGASVRNSAHGKGHEEGSLAYAKA